MTATKYAAFAYNWCRQANTLVFYLYLLCSMYVGTCRMNTDRQQQKINQFIFIILQYHNKNIFCFH